MKGLFYKENLRPIPKLKGVLNDIVDQRISKGKKQIKIKSKNKPAVWKDLESFMLTPKE